jgi:hypothetical protein
MSEVGPLMSTDGQNLNRPSVHQALRTQPPTFPIVAIDGLCDDTNSVYRPGRNDRAGARGSGALAD